MDIMILDDEARVELLTEEEKRLYDNLMPEQQEEVRAFVEMELSIPVIVHFQSNAGTTRLLALALERAKPLMPEITQDAVGSLFDLFFKMTKIAVDDVMEDRCPGCHQKHDEDDEDAGSTIH